MAHEFDTTIGGANTTSYINLTDADSYWGDRVFANAAWNAAANGLKQSGLNWASRLLDEWVDWNGLKVIDTQRLRWPRYSVLDMDGYLLDSNSIPRFLENATAELAGYLLTADSTKQPDTLGFSKLKAGDLELEIDKADRDRYGTIPDAVLSMVEFYGSVRKIGGAGTVDLIRS